MSASKNSRLEAGHHKVHTIAAAAAVLAALSAGASQALAQGAETYEPGRILVLPRAGLPEAALTKILKDHGGGKARGVGNSGLRIVELTPGMERQMVERLSRHPHLKFAEVDRRIRHDLAVNDPYLGSQWHLSKIGAYSAWNGAQGAGVTIAVLDSGIDTLHPDLVSRLVPGHNFADGSGTVEDVRDHGTKVAGVAAAASNNGLGVASVAGQLKVMPIRVSDSTGHATWSAIAAGLTHAADRGARVANVSFSGAAGSAAVLSAASYMKNKGGLVFLSAGNSNVNPGYANTSAVVIVAATDSNDTKASFSNFGDHVHLAAPGTGIFTTTWGQSYTSVAGTSFSAPIAAGVAALVMSANPLLSAAQVENILFATAVDLGAAGRDVHFGHGRVDAAAAVSAALATVGSIPAPDTLAPGASITTPLGSSTVSGLVPVSVAVSDNVGVTRAELLVNGRVVVSDSSAPFAFSWDTTTSSNGLASVNVRAFDAAGNAGLSPTVAVNVANTVAPDVQAPEASFRNPANGARVSGSVSVEVNASDNSGVAGLRMALSINGKQVASSIASGTLNYTWNTRKAPSGNHTLSFVAVDAAGNRSTGAVTVTR